MKARLKATIGAAIVSAALVATPNAALANYDECPQGNICFFDGHDGTGAMLPLPPVQRTHIGDGWNDRASSVWNRSGDVLCIWTDVDYSGLHYLIGAGQKQELLFSYDKAVSSFSINQCGG